MGKRILFVDGDQTIVEASNRCSVSRSHSIFRQVAIALSLYPSCSTINITSWLGSSLCPVVQEINDPDYGARTKHAGNDPVFVSLYVDQDRPCHGSEKVAHKSNCYGPDRCPDRVKDKETDSADTA